jgi:hypothetical protein
MIARWTKAGRIKALIIVIVAAVNLFVPLVSVTQVFNRPAAILLFLFGSTAVPFVVIVTYAGKIKIPRPSWNENPFVVTTPLNLFQFGAYLFITFGLTEMARTLVRTKGLSSFGLNLFSFGVGMLMGISLLMLLPRNQE